MEIYIQDLMNKHMNQT